MATWSDPIRNISRSWVKMPWVASVIEGESADAAGSHKEQLRFEQVKQLFVLAPIGLIATFINSVLVFFVMTDLLPRRMLLSWLLAVFAVALARLWLVFRFRQLQPAIVAATWERWFLGSLVVMGLTWGSIGVFPFTSSIAHQVFLAFVLGGMAAGASSTFSKVRFGYEAFSIPALLPIIVHFALVPDDFHRAMSGMTLLYLVLLGRIARHNHLVNLESLLLRFENEDIIQGLQRAKLAVEALNARLRKEIDAKLGAEAELRSHHERLERVVEDRTADLQRANVQLKETQEKLIAAKDAAEAGNAAKTEFLANMSHEMRTPLAGVLGMIQLVLEMEIGAEERQLLEMAERSGGSLLRIIADVLDFSRLEAGAMQFEHKPFSIAKVVEAAVEVVSVAASQRGLQLSWKVEGGVPDTVEGDAGRVRQVLVNLLGNAVKFTERGGIEVAVASVDGTEPGVRRLRFSVKDTGIGIAPEQVEKIFGKFTQIDSSLTKRHGGTGLGLALSRQIVEKMGGQIWVESTPGKGSAFHFELPLDSPAP